ncbi:histidine phosphatase family protein [Lacticaseibacillus pabuli]|uniref:Histidine phosphatase family protein n=1 Tax=Lacticaseibacillus pabuli TaxID=3025672 RepID=A0ABY7WT13_9LACO|nr:histidine phosphatase family protein [Lacticaseibacillus sp. KACC 23028]WDF83266.1 histidine phosphatase family protein [Lacticaseibacillus sp. KACC 23028]
MKKIIYLMRHGETLFNAENRIQGWCDSPLTDRGIAQAESIGRYFQRKGITIQSAYTSTSERAMDTLSTVAGEMGKTIPTHQLKTLKEANFGSFEGMPEYLNPPRPYGDFFLQYGGESDDQVQARVTKAIHDIAVNDPSTAILIVSHAGAIYSFIAYYIEAAFERFHTQMTNSTVLQLAFEDDTFTLTEVINPEQL